MNQKKNDKNFSTTSNTSSQLSPIEDASSFTSERDTIHYLSPATTCRSQYEGDIDFDYKLFSPFYPIINTLSDFLGSETVSCEEPQLQRTVAIIKPKAMIFQDVVLESIKNAGFSVLNQRTVHLTPEQATELYSQYYDCPSFPTMVVSVSIGPLLVLSLAALNAVKRWKDIVGDNGILPEDWFLPVHIRNRFGLHLDIPEALHGSDNTKNALYENRYFFPKSILEPIVDNNFAVEDYCNVYLNPTILSGLVDLVKKKPLEPIIFLAEWLLMHNPFQPMMSYKYATAPT